MFKKSNKVRCKRCKRIAFEVSTKYTMAMPFKCAHCGTFQIYNAETGKSKISREPSRAQSSGKRFY